MWTSEVAQQFIIVLGTVEVPVSDVAGVDTDSRGPAAIETWTHVAVTPRLVLAARAVVDTVTANKHRQTVHPLTGALEVCLWTQAAL